MIAAISQRRAIEKIINHLGLDPQPPPRAQLKRQRFTLMGYLLCRTLPCSSHSLAGELSKDSASKNRLLEMQFPTHG